MSNLTFKQVQVSNGTIYDVEDAWARQKIKSIGKPIQYIGAFPATITPTLAEDDERTSFKYPDESDFEVNGVKYEAQSGDVFTNNGKELMFDGVSEKWIEFGDASNLGDLAYCDSATGSVTATGSVSQPTFTGTQVTINSSGSVSGNVTVTVESDASTGNYTPSGGVSISSSDVADSAAATEYNYTPKGTVSKPNVTVTPSTTSITPFGSAGSLPSLTTSVVNEVLIFSFDAGTLPSGGTAVTAVTGVSAELAATPTFTGKHALLGGTFSGDGVQISGVIANGATASVSAPYTPAGTVSQPTFTGTPASVTVTGDSE